MKVRSLVLVTLLFAALPLAFSQKVSTNKRTPARLESREAAAKTGAQVDQVLADVLGFQPSMPRGPVEILREYENEMTLISQTFSAEMAVITQGVRQGQISRDQADYLIQQRFQIAMMQYEVVNGLHDALAVELSRTPVVPHSQASPPETTIVVQPPFPVPSGPSTPGQN